MKKAPIHALTVNQPWAFWMVRPDLLGPERRRAYGQGLMKGVVEVELPSARQLAGEYLAIHVGQAFEYVPSRWLRERGIKVEHPPSEHVIHRAIIGVAYVAAFVTAPPQQKTPSSRLAILFVAPLGRTRWRDQLQFRAIRIHNLPAQRFPVFLREQSRGRCILPLPLPD